jgi:hypothetical protein
MNLRMAYLKKGAVALVTGLAVVMVFFLARLYPGQNVQGASTTLTMLGRTNESGRQVVVFELRVAPGRRVGIRRANLVTDWGTSVAVYAPPEWTQGCDPTRKAFGPRSRTYLTIVEPSERLRRLRLQTMEYEVGPRAWWRKLKMTWQTKSLSVLKLDLPPEHRVDTYVQSGLISSYATEP